MQEEEQVIPNNKKASLIKPLIAIFILLIIGISATLYTIKMQPQLLGLSKGQADSQAEADRTVEEVGKLIVLPTDEKPTIATVSDVEKVKEQPFFKNAKNDDKVLIYTNAKKAILYRPSEKRIIEVGAVNINQQPQTVTESPVPSASPEASE